MEGSIGSLLKVISGGQTGADIAGLRAAKSVGLQTGGCMPQGFKTLAGSRPDYVDLYNVHENDTTSYRDRTHKNVRDSDGTLRLAYNFATPGEICTSQAIFRYQRPSLDVLFKWDDEVLVPTLSPQMVQAWIEEHAIQVLNVAGNAGKAFESAVEIFLVNVFANRRLRAI